MRSGYWHDLTTTDLAAVDAERVIALLPVGATEQHGPHLPLGTDRMIADALAGAVLAGAGDDPAVLVLPTQAIGDSLEHAAFPGTLTAQPETLIALWCDIGYSLARTGIRKLAILNTHGGQPQVVDIVAQRLRAECDMLVARINSFMLGTPDEFISEDEAAFGYHGGALETSVMLHIAPRQVRAGEVDNFSTEARRLAQENTVLRAEAHTPGEAGIAWMAQDLNPRGAMGDATQGSAEAGQQLVEHMAAHVLAVLTDMRRFPLRNLKPGPLDEA